jgi:hypothetical protein
VVRASSKIAGSARPVGEVTDRLEDALRGMIERGEYKEGDRLPSERQLATQYGAGRTTVRLVLTRLAAQGLVEARSTAAGTSYVPGLGLDLVGVQSGDPADPRQGDTSSSARVNLLPVPVVPDFTGLPIGLREDGGLYRLRLFGTQILIVGATNAGKGSVIWSLIRALASGVASGLVQLWGIDPKGGMELGLGRPLFARFVCKNFPDMVGMLEDAAAEASRRAEKLGGHVRQHQPSTGDPLIVLVIDELATLTACLTDRQLKDRVKAALGVLLTKGRAVGCTCSPPSKSRAKKSCRSGTCSPPASGCG